MDKTPTCLLHTGKPNELMCMTCKTYLCTECLTTHCADGHKPEYIHISQYAPKYALPKVDQLLMEISGKDSDINYEATEFVSAVQSMLPSLQEAINAHAQATIYLRGLVRQLEGFIVPTKPQPYIERMRSGMTQDKKKLEEALKTKNIKEAIRLTQKIEAESAIASSTEETKRMAADVKAALVPLENRTLYNPIIAATQKIVSKCQHLRLAGGSGGAWKIDRKYLSSKLTLSEDGLNLGNSASSGYPSVIGDTPFDCGIYAFQVIPRNLDCGSKEGFGIIELERYKTAYEADKSTPNSYDNMIGFLYRDVAKNMETVKGHEMQMGEKYTVKVDLIRSTMSIKGPELHLKATLKADTVYVPCFSLGCSGNKIEIKVLDIIEDEDE